MEIEFVIVSGEVGDFLYIPYDGCGGVLYFGRFLYLFWAVG